MINGVKCFAKVQESRGSNQIVSAFSRMLSVKKAKAVLVDSLGLKPN
jgi:hypothetical protein